MPYDHSTKIGNQGDVVKHVALYAALRYLLRGRAAKQDFVYADIHAGRPQYVLPEEGKWRSGIGIFSTLEEIKKDRKQRKDGNGTKLGIIGDFDEMIVGRPITTGMIYPGSAGIAFRILHGSNTRFTMKLWEEDRAAADDCERFFYPWEEQVRTICDDGYQIVTDMAPFSLVLIDPPALEAGAVLETMAEMNERGVPFICWTPRTSRSIKPTTPDGDGSAAEAGTSTDYIQAAVKCGSCLRVQWHPWGCRTPGCCITVSAKLSKIVSAAVRKVTTLMSWQFEE